MKMLIISSVADLRKEPVEANSFYAKDPLQESQLLYGERILVKHENNGWIFIEAIEQQKFISNWQGYPGWIKKTQAVEVADFPLYNLVVSEPWVDIISESDQLIVPVSLGTKLKGFELKGLSWKLQLPDGTMGYIPQEKVRSLSDYSNFGKNVIAMGEKLLNHPYHWGGCSIYRDNFKDALTSVDCSSLTHLLYRVHGKEIPRDAHDQFLKSLKRSNKEAHELELGDLIFIRYHDKPDRIGHVMLYSGGDGILDANITDKRVVKTTAALRYGRSLKTMKSGDDIGPGIIYFG
jgi:gamma-D-glutamyl-L-lysine dipeptidyl-peptidase